MTRVLLTIMLSLVLLTAAVHADEDNFQYTKENLAGKWEGTPPLGGKLTLDIKISGDGEISGTGVIPKPAGARPVVFGKFINRHHINLNYRLPMAGGSQVFFVCDWLEPKRLHCVTRQSKHETDFVKE
jgi:hypothetical protein